MTGFTEHPAHAVGDIRLAAAIGTDDRGDARLEHELRPIGKAFEALQFETCQARRERIGDRHRAAVTSGGERTVRPRWYHRQWALGTGQWALGTGHWALARIIHSRLRATLQVETWSDSKSLRDYDEMARRLDGERTPVGFGDG